jgi:hypothetical protein
MESKALIPVRQALVPFHGHKVLSVRLQDDHVAANHTALCRMLKLDREGQIQRIQRDAHLARYLVRVRIETAGGPQETEFLLVEGIAEWTLSIHFNKLAPEKRPLLIALKVEAVQVFYDYFFKTGPHSRPAAGDPAASQGQRPAEGAAAHKFYSSSWDKVYEGLDTMRAGLQDVQQEQQELEAQVRAQHARYETDQAQMQLRLARLEQGHPSAAPDAQGRQRPDGSILSPKHIVELVVLARALRAQTGESIPAMYAELAEVFDVEDFSDIPDAGWEVVQEWFLRRAREA